VRALFSGFNWVLWAKYFSAMHAAGLLRYNLALFHDPNLE